MIKKFLSFALALVLALGVFSFPAFAAGAISLDKTNYAPNEKITVTASGITEQMIKDRVFVSVYEADAGHGDWGEYHRPQAATDTLTFTAPAASGSYEMRLYSADPGGRNAPAFEAVFVTAVPFTVGSAPAATTPPEATPPAATQTTGSGQGITIRMKLNDPYMTVNGQRQEVDPGRGTSPITINDRTMIPIRAVVEAMGGSIGWEDATQKITITANNHELTMWLGKTDLVVDGQNKTMDVAPQSVNDRTLVPVRFAAENVGYGVEWLEATSEVVISSGSDGTVATSPPATTPPVTTTPPATTPPATTTPEPTPTPTTPPTQPPSGDINPELVGPWRGSFNGWSFYYDFRVDGSFSFHRISSVENSFGVTITEQRYLVVGNWLMSGDIVYLTQQKLVTWDPIKMGDIPSNPEWQTVADESMHIEFLEPNYSINEYRRFRNYEIFSDTAWDDGTRAFLTVENSRLPSWVWLGI